MIKTFKLSLDVRETSYIGNLAALESRVLLLTSHYDSNWGNRNEQLSKIPSPFSGSSKRQSVAVAQNFS